MRYAYLAPSLTSGDRRGAHGPGDASRGYPHVDPGPAWARLFNGSSQMAQTADILTFPPRQANPVRPGIVFVGLDLSNRRDNVVGDLFRAARPIEDDRAELVTALLLTIEGEYLSPVLCYPSRGEGRVTVMVGTWPFILRPEDCRTAARVLIDENAFAGCIGIAADLREAAALAEADTPRPRLIPAETPCGRPGVTGMGTTLFMGGLIGLAFAFSLFAAVLG